MLLCMAVPGGFGQQGEGWECPDPQLGSASLGSWAALGIGAPWCRAAALRSEQPCVLRGGSWQHGGDAAAWSAAGMLRLQISYLRQQLNSLASSLLAAP